MVLSWNLSTTVVEPDPADPATSHIRASRAPRNIATHNTKATAHPTVNREDEPPSYAAAFSERDPSRTDVIKTACRALDHRAHSSLDNGDARSTYRLRNWLCYMLMVDYKVATASAPITLSAIDAAHFDNLFATLEAYTSINNATSQPHTHAATLESHFWLHIHLPCLALNLPTATVALYLRHFAVNKTASLNTYAGCCRSVLQTHGVRSWAAKLLTDRSVVPRVAPNHALEQGLLQTIKKHKDAWFVRLDGFDCDVAQRLELRPPKQVMGRDDDDGGWRHAAVGAFELTQMGKQWETRWAESRKVARLQQLTGQQRHPDRGAGLWEKLKSRFETLRMTGSFSLGQQQQPQVLKNTETTGDKDAEDGTDSFFITETPDNLLGGPKRLY